MRFILIGFRQDTGQRVFAFERIAEDRSRTGFTVSTDLALSRRYGIPVQELPLLCRVLLEGRGELDPERAVIFTEADMRIHVTKCAGEKKAKGIRPSTRPIPAEPVRIVEREPEMNVPIEEPVLINEERWQVWLQRGKRQNEASAKVVRVLVAVVLVLVAIGAFAYRNSRLDQKSVRLVTSASLPASLT